ncbi:hypothetical protein [Ferrimonas lipolytica]|uniref:Uncharacterized protein n=1 Tax=Ferrimonas lipolytica TaxID=2724191 RepID=A0A6H1U998_9GAMM|nr:hypothetical protein [Ferrimonas lipolytica]QIZ75625.1 hypothetical protein HER31_01145 [Ferrimonas lipolytica]
MTPFEISRIETASGVYRISGSYDLSGRALQFDFTAAAVMATDGWEELNVKSKGGLARLQKLIPELLLHLEV